MILYHGTPLESGEKRLFKKEKYDAKLKEVMKDMRILLKVRQMDLCI